MRWVLLVKGIPRRLRWVVSKLVIKIGDQHGDGGMQRAHTQ